MLDCADASCSRNQQTVTCPANWQVPPRDNELLILMVYFL